MPVSISTSGKSNFVEELEKVLAAAERGMTKAMLACQRDTALNTHVITGNLRRSWTYGVERDGSTIEGAVGSNVAYAPAEDERHGNLTPTMNENAATYSAIVADEVKQAIGG